MNNKDNKLLVKNHYKIMKKVVFIKLQNNKLNKFIN